MNAPIATPLMWLKMVFQEKENKDIFVEIKTAIIVVLFVITVIMDVEKKSKRKFLKWLSMEVESEIQREF